MVEQPDIGVVHVIGRYPPVLGGAEKVAQSLATRRRNTRDTVVLTSRGTHGELNPEERGFVRRFRALNLARTKIMPGLAGALLRLPRQSVIHLHINSAFVPETVYVAHVLRGIRYIAHLHFDISTSRHWAGPVLRRIWMPFVLRRVLRAAAAVVVFTEEQRQAIAAEYGVGLGRIFAIRNGVEDSFFNADDRALHARPRLLFVGRLATEKNVSALLAALAGISDRFETTVVGEGPLELDLRNKSTELGLQNVRFYGTAEGDELRGLYRAADVLVLPSNHEGMSLVLLEALAMGLPVVATDISGNREVVIHGENGLLVPPDDPAALTGALLEVIEDRDRYQHMSSTARKLAEQYRWEAIGDDFERLYRLAGAPARG
jgi:glycosyltransferase involved in cell wall biosynthesis